MKTRSEIKDALLAMGWEAREDGTFRLLRDDKSRLRSTVELSDDNMGLWHLTVALINGVPVATGFDPVALAKWGAEVGYCCRLDEPVPFIGANMRVIETFTEEQKAKLVELGFDVHYAVAYLLPLNQGRVYARNAVEADGEFAVSVRDATGRRWASFDDPIAAACWLKIEVSNG